MKLAQKLEVNSLAIPFLSTGVYGYPLEDAVKIAVETVKKFDLEARIYFVAFDESTEEITKKCL